MPRRVAERRVGGACVDAHRRLGVDRLRRRHVDVAHDPSLGIVAPTVGRPHPLAGQRVGHRRVDAAVAHRRRHVGGRADDLGGHADPEVGLGETDQGPVDVAGGAAGGVAERDANRRRPVGGREADELTGQQRALVEGHVERLAVVDLDAHRRQVSPGQPVTGLQQGDVVDGAVGRDLEVLAARIEHAPCGVRVAVDGHRRAGLRAVGERLAVRRGHGVQRSVLHRDGARVEGGAGEHVEAGVARVRPQRRRLVARLGVPGDVLRRPPLVGAQPVGVGDHQGAGGADRVEQIVALERGAVADHLVAGDQSRCGQVDQAVAASRHQGLVVGGAHDRHRVAHRHQFDRGDRGEHRRVRQRLLVDHRHLRPVDHRVAVGHRVAEAARRIGGGRGVERTGGLRARRAEAVERHVTGDPHGVGAEQAGDRGDRLGLGPTLLEAVVEGVQQVHRRGRAEGQQVARHQRARGQPGQRRIDGVPPAVGTELGPGQLQHAIAGRHRIERGGGVVPRRRRLFVAGERRVDQAVTEQRREVAQREEDHEPGGEEAPPRTSVADRVDDRRRPEADPDRQQRQRPRARAQGERHAGLTVAGEEVGERRGVVERVHADRQHHADERQGHCEPAGGEPREHQPDQSDQHEHEPERHRVRQHVATGRRHVVGSGGRGRGERVAHVRQPVTEATPHLGRRRREADVLQRFRVGEQIGALAALDRQHHQPPQRGADRQDPDAGGGDDGPADRHRAFDHGEQQPQQRRRSHHRQGGRVHRTGGGDHQCAQRGVPPPRSGRRADREAEHPAQAGPREQHRRRARDVRHEVRGQLVDQPGGDRRGEPEAEPAPHGPGDSGAGGEHDRGDPQAVGDPVGQADRLRGHVPRAGRPQVGDHLVRHPPRELAGVERPDRVRHQSSRVEVEVQLGVGGHRARRRHQRRHVGEYGHQRHRDDGGGRAPHPGRDVHVRLLSRASRRDDALRR